MNNNHATLEIDLLLIPLLTTSNQSDTTLITAVRNAGFADGDLEVTTALRRLVRLGIAEANAEHNAYKLDPLYVVANQVGTPTFSPKGGEYGVSLSATISSSISGAAIYYTTDGSTPTTGSTLYSGPISVTDNTTIKALATASGLYNSNIGTVSYVTQVNTPTFSPVAGSYVGTQSVTLSSTTSGASFYYTTDGSNPTINSTLYSGPISVAASETVKAIAVKSGRPTSAVGSAAYVIS